jgi:hypothetical protein
VESEKDKVIARLRREVAIKREYTGELEERVRELEDENSQLYSKLITTAKQTSDFAIRGSPAKIKQLLTNTHLTGDRPASPRKKVSARAYEEEVVEVLESKFRQESIQERHAPLDEYLRTYFAMKYGKPLADQNESSFREAVGLLARAQERHIFLLFEAILEGLCEESYYFEDRQAHERIAKCIKRYLHEKYGRPQHELDRLLDWRTVDDKGDLPLAEADLEPILSNVYKSTEVHTLELILSEVISARSVERGLTCRRLLAEILNYELSKHLLRVEDVVREARRVADGSTSLTYDQLQQVMVRVVKDRNRYPLLTRHAAEWAGRKFTISEVIETIERIRRAKMSPRD